MDFVVILGLIAASLTTLSYIPQLIKIKRTKSVEDLSLGMFIALTTGFTLWLIYGFLINSLPIIFSNVLAVTLSFLILLLKIKYNKK
ncbi:MAG: SemiSWEET transporter [Patescibacteria group bacterium]|nr:SemiSWEET transporter [Patescibacteria group bacterium]